MGRVDARGIIAMMAHTKIGRDGTKMDLPRVPVRIHEPWLGDTLSKKEGTVVPICCAEPLPTILFGSPMNLLPESYDGIDSRFQMVIRQETAWTAWPGAARIDRLSASTSAERRGILRLHGGTSDTGSIVLAPACYSRFGAFR